MPTRKVDPYDARTMYENGVSVKEIAERFGVSRIAIWMNWKRIGFSTDGYRVKRRCKLCGKTVLRRRDRALKSASSYCSKVCYMEYIKANGEGHYEWRQGQRRARKEVSKHFTLLPGMVVHHVDKDGRHNQIGNLWVFSTQVEHMRYHRGRTTKPIFRGDRV